MRHPHLLAKQRRASSHAVSNQPHKAAAPRRPSHPYSTYPPIQRPKQKTRRRLWWWWWWRLTLGLRQVFSQWQRSTVCAVLSSAPALIAPTALAAPSHRQPPAAPAAPSEIAAVHRRKTFILVKETVRYINTCLCHASYRILHQNRECSDGLCRDSMCKIRLPRKNRTIPPFRERTRDQ